MNIWTTISTSLRSGSIVAKRGRADYSSTGSFSRP